MKQAKWPTKTNRFDWKTIFNGKCWVLEKGEDFQNKPENFRIIALDAARRKKVVIKTAIVKNKVYIQAIK